MTENPLRAGLETERTPAPCVFVIFGASGDLTRRKLLPALYNLAVSRLLPPGISIVGFAMTEISEERVSPEHARGRRASSRAGSPSTRRCGRTSRAACTTCPASSRTRTSFARLREKLEELDKVNGTRGNRIYYLAIPPSLFRTVNDNLAKAGLVAEPRRRGPLHAHHRREALRARPRRAATPSTPTCTGSSHESQIFRIDHYLGKETVQNLVALRFGNAIFEPLWNRKHIDHVQITVAEDIGVEGRGKFYEEAGTTRDIVQNHLLQLLMVAAMEPPVAFDADEVRDEKVKVLRAIQPIVGKDVARAARCAGSTAPATSRGRPRPATARSRTCPRRRTWRPTWR